MISPSQRWVLFSRALGACAPTWLTAGLLSILLKKRLEKAHWGAQVGVGKSAVVETLVAIKGHF